MPKIHSIIEITYDGCRGDCAMPKTKHKSTKEPHSHHYRSEAKSDSNRFFHSAEKKTEGVTQTVNVEVNIDQKDDCLTSCFSGLAKCFGKGGA